MSMSEYVETRGIEEVATPGMEEVQQKDGIPAIIKAASILMYILAVLFVFAVLGGKTMAVIFIPLVVYLAYGLNSLKASARTGALAFACFGLLVNLSAYFASKFTMHAVLLDVAFYVAILTLLFTPSASKANWVGKRAV
ncbi:MAG: hypothetical protein ACOYU4_00570 [Thermodesulfobacteriota bacterium]